MTDDIQKFKLIFLGDQGVGKSSILNRFAQDRFEQEYQATIGLDFHSKNATINGATVRLLLYDTAGQEKFRSLIPMYIRDANIIIVVYDITMKSSFINSNFWINETNDLKQENSMFVLVGNKLDLESERQVNAKEAEAFAKEKKFLFFEVSAKTGENVREMFQNYIYPRMAEKFRIFGDEYEGPVQQGDVKQNEAGIKLDDEGEKKKKKKGCCGKSKKSKKKDGNE
jgi:small GTP-binding protein